MALVPSPAPMATPTTTSGRPTASRVSVVSPMPTATTTRVRGAATSQGPWALPMAKRQPVRGRVAQRRHPWPRHPHLAQRQQLRRSVGEWRRPKGQQCFYLSRR
ncbi:hypothetical protein ZIOFF_004429 [Zingiber officinale]|uniref:Uncharacterized protein n=1 Tax=Zingiber officinale TaxID=94328 RepID=A0A8J5MAV5_ZINOF|nr:hypothetical protein ZIOFF_004429 [Zingiber officinale]